MVQVNETGSCFSFYFVSVSPLMVFELAANWCKVGTSIHVNLMRGFMI
jgi:hypothetical protein